MNDLLDRPIPGDIIGYLDSGEPIRLAAGASDDDDDDGVGLDLEDGASADDDGEQDDADDTDSDDEGDDSKAKPEKPASRTYTQADVDALLAARDKRLDDTRTQLRRAQARLAKSKTDKKPPADGDGEAAAQAIEDAVSAERAKWQREIVHERAEKELIKAGLHIPDGDDGKRMKRLLRTIDYDKVEFEDGEIYGLDDQVEDLKNDYPELFRKPEAESTQDTKTRIRAPKGDAADRKNAPQKPKTTGELYAQQILGR